jgi:hypothetical protein
LPLLDVRIDLLGNRVLLARDAIAARTGPLVGTLLRVGEARLLLDVLAALG